jgi:hypothetical protein
MSLHAKSASDLLVATIWRYNKYLSTIRHKKLNCCIILQKQQQRPTMQLFSILTILMLSTSTIVPTMVSADQMVRYIFNNGIEPSTPACTATDNAMIDALFVNRRRRQLTTNNDTIARGLVTYPAICKQNCLGISSCYATGCGGYDGTIKINKRKLTVCDTVLAAINQKLDALPVSTTCKSFLHSSKRTSECYDDVRYGVVFGAKIWTISGSTQTAADLPLTGYSFCKSKTFNIEAVLNECVDVAGFRLNGPNGYTAGRFENNIPYSLFGDDGTKYFGTTLPYTGVYSLTIKPDNYIEKQKVFTFTVNNC